MGASTQFAIKAKHSGALCCNENASVPRQRPEGAEPRVGTAQCGSSGGTAAEGPRSNNSAAPREHKMAAGTICRTSKSAA